MNAPFCCLYSTMRWAITSPMPGRAVSSSAEAVFIFIGKCTAAEEAACEEDLFFDEDLPEDDADGKTAFDETAATADDAAGEGEGEEKEEEDGTAAERAAGVGELSPSKSAANSADTVAESSSTSAAALWLKNANGGSEAKL